MVGPFDRIRKQLDVIVVFLLALWLFEKILFESRVITDMITHAEHTIRMAQGDYLPGHFLYFVTVYLLSFGSTNFETILGTSAVVLSGAVAAKYIVTKKILVASMSVGKVRIENEAALASLVGLLLLICFSLPFSMQRMYLGQFPPNVWHNSTTIFLMPFALWLFWQSYRYLERPNTRYLFDITLLGLLNLAVKPSFFFCYAIAFPAMSWFVFRFGRSFWRSLAPVAIACILLSAQSYLNFGYDLNRQTLGSNQITVDFLKIWSVFSSNPLKSLFLSVPFPLAFGLFYFREAVGTLLLRYALLLFSVAVMIAAFMAETGHRANHGNFLWQAMICNYVLFVATAAVFLGILIEKKTLTWKDQTIAFAFLLHVASGIAYLSRWLHTSVYR